MEFVGNIHKMRVELAKPVDYSFVLARYVENENLDLNTKNNLDKNHIEFENIHLNSIIDKEITIEFTGKINCVNCARSIRKTFHQGYCYTCFKTLAVCDMCIMKPELCHYHLGTCREPAWGLEHCFKPHIIYLANSSGIKVGITRQSQIPTRWIDQGAIAALPIIKVQSRLQSGLIEKEIAKLISDKTNWRKMLKSDFEDVDLCAKRDAILQEIATTIQEIAKKFSFGDIEFLLDEDVVEIQYPIIKVPEKITSLSLDKTHKITQKLMGIKGQYLIFTDGVMNVRNLSGYEVKLKI